MPGVLLSATSITKTFAGVQALKGVSLEVRAGEVHALVGENGAGKSTLIRIMTGAERPDRGSLVVDGRVMSGLDPAEAHALGIAAVYQQPSLFPHLTVAENLAIGVERSRPWQRVDWAARRGRARELLARIGAAIDADRTVDTLSMPEQQLVEIARALGTDARVLIFDEPTASLTSRDVDSLLETVRRLRREGVGIVYISHRIDEVLTVADRVTVLRDGNAISTEPAAGLTPADVVRLMVGSDLHDPPVRQPHHGGEIALELSEVGCNTAGVHGVSLTLRRGEILGLAGLVGSGRTQLAETIFGITPSDAGSISLAGRRVAIRQPADAIRARIGYVPEDRRRHGVVLDMSIAANRSLASLQQVSRRGLIDRDAERQRALDAMRELFINAPSPVAEVSTLSGGNQQKVAVSRWLATSPLVLILDEPTQGVDVRAKGEIHCIVQELADQGMAVLLISSDLSELLLLSDRVAVMRGGTIVGVLPRSDASRHTVLALALGTAPPVRGLRAGA